MKNCRKLLLQSAALLSEHPEFETPSDIASPLTFFANEKRYGRRHQCGRHTIPLRPEETEKEDEDARLLQQRVRDPHHKVQFRSEEEMLSSFLSRHEITDEADRTFITEVFYGCIRQEKVLKSSLDLFYRKFGREFLRNEYNIFGVLLYLALHRMEELTFSVFNHFVKAVNDASKMYKFISFLFSPDLVKDPPETNSLRAAWCKIFDSSFVTETLANPLIKWFNDAQNLLLELKAMVEVGMVPKKSSKAPAKPRPFLLTKPKPNAGETRSEVYPVLKAKPAPKTTYQPSMNVREKGGATRKRIMERDMKAKKNNAQAQAALQAAVGLRADREDVQSSSASPETPSCPAQIRAASSASEACPLMSETGLSAPLRSTGIINSKGSASTGNSSFLLARPQEAVNASEVERRTASPKSVKLTVGAILREEALMKKRTAEEHAKVAEAEVLMRDGREYSRWRAEMKLRDEEERRLDAERRRLEVQILHEEAITAKGEVIKEKHEIADEVKAASAHLKVLAGYEQHELAQENARKKEQTQAGYARVLEAKKKVAEENQKKAEVVQAENAVMHERAKREAAEEYAKKVELIRQIRLLDTMPVPKNKIVDLAEAAGNGLLSEMSIVELQLRLAMIKETLAQEEEKRRQTILKQKRQQEKTIADKLRSLQEYRIWTSKKAKPPTCGIGITGHNSCAQAESERRRTMSPSKQTPGVSFTVPAETRESADVSSVDQAKIRKIMSLKEKLASKKKARIAQRLQQKRQQALLQSGEAGGGTGGGSSSTLSSISHLHSNSLASVRSRISSAPRLCMTTSAGAVFSSSATLSSRVSVADISRKGSKAAQPRWSELDVIEKNLEAQLQSTRAP